MILCNGDPLIRNDILLVHDSPHGILPMSDRAALGDPVGVPSCITLTTHALHVLVNQNSIAICEPSALHGANGCSCRVSLSSRRGLLSGNFLEKRMATWGLELQALTMVPNPSLQIASKLHPIGVSAAKQSQFHCKSSECLVRSTMGGVASAAATTVAVSVKQCRSPRSYRLREASLLTQASVASLQLDP